MEGGVSPRNQLAGAPIGTTCWGTGSWPQVTAWIFLPSGAETLEGPQGVMAGGALGAGSWVLKTLVDIVFAGVALKARWAAALDLGVGGQTRPSVHAGVG